MEVQRLNAMPEAEKTICLAARNDYLSEWIGEMTLDEAMSAIDTDDNQIEEVKTLVRNLYGDIDEASFEHLVQRESKKRTLINHLLKHGHYGPFEHVQIVFAVKGISRSCMAQITRHRHASFDIQSMRYVSFEDANPEPGDAVVMIPELEEAEPAGRNVEFSDEWEDTDDEELLEERRKTYEEAIRTSFEKYRDLLNMGTAPENARMVLPIGTKVNMVVSLNARMLMHIADMRAAGDAQWEIRALTDAEKVAKQLGEKDWLPDRGILQIAEDWCPHTFDYYNAEMKNRKNRLAP